MSVKNMKHSGQLGMPKISSSFDKNWLGKYLWQKTSQHEAQFTSMVCTTR